MVTVPVAENRVGIADVTDAKLRTPDMSGVGEGLARGLQSVGAGGQELAHTLRANANDEQNAAAGIALERAVQSTEQFEQQDRDGKTPGAQPRGVGHTDRVTGEYDAQTAAILDGLKDKRLRAHWQQQILASRGNITARTRSFEMQQQHEGAVADTQDHLTLAASRISRSDNADDITDAADTFGAGVTQMAVDDATKEKLLHAGALTFGRAYLLGQVERHPDRVAAQIATGKFDNLGPETLHTLQDSADVELRRQAAVAQHAKELADRQARQGIATVTKQLGAGVQVPPDVVERAAATARALGDESGAFELDNLRLQQGINRETEGFTPQQYDAEIARLRAKGTARTPTEDLRLKHFETIAPARIAQIRDDPYQWAALNGHAPAPVNFADPASIQQRLQLQATVGASLGIPPPFLTRNETADLRAQVDANPNARTQVLNTLGNIAAVDRNAAARAAHQVFPGDPIAPRIVLLNPHDRASAVRGQAARAKDRAIIDGPGTDGTKALALAKYQRDVQPALSNLNPEDADAVREMAGNMYADWATTHGVHDFNEGQYGTFLQRALGGQVGSDGLFRGGVGYWNNSPMVLPSNTTQRQFENLFTHLQWAKDYYPVYNRGEKMPPEALRQMVPVIQPNGRYEFHGPNGAVIHGSDGGTFTLDFEALAARRFR